jgi:hypothetical protein
MGLIHRKFSGAYKRQFATVSRRALELVPLSLRVWVAHSVSLDDPVATSISIMSLETTGSRHSTNALSSLCCNRLRQTPQLDDFLYRSFKRWPKYSELIVLAGRSRYSLGLPSVRAVEVSP